MSPNRVGRYSVVGTLTKGADEEVLVGELAGRRFAIRVFDLSDREASLANARKIAGLSHPSIAPQEVGLHEDRPFLAAELPGVPLETWLGEDHALPELLLVIESVASALNFAHAEGVAHGRLAPGRILVGADGGARIWGFSVEGMAPDRANADYIAPEVLEGGEPTPQADVYSAGVVFYEILAGDASAGEAPRPLRDVRKDTPKDLADAILACRERAVDWRPRDLEYLLEVVHKLRGSIPAAKPKPVARPSFEPPRPRPNRPAAGRPPMLPIAIAGALLLGGGAYYFLGPRGPSGAVPPTTLPRPLPSTTVAAALSPPVSPTAAPTPSTTPSPPATLAPAVSLAPSKPTSPPTTAATPPPTTTLPPATTTTTTFAPASATLPPATTLPAEVPAGPILVRTVSPPSLRRGQRTLVDVRGQNLYSGLAALLLRGGRAAEGIRVVQQRFVNPTLLQVFIEVDAEAAPGSYAVLLSDGQTVTNAVRFDVAK